MDSVRISSLIAGLCMLAGVSGHADALTTDLSLTPPDLNASVAPNIAVTFDDSGSMSFAYMPDNATDCDTASVGQYTYFGYNKIYYNPAITYTVPLDKDGVPFPAANVQWPKVPLDGYYSYLGFGSATVDLSTSYRPTYRWNQDHNTSQSTNNCRTIKTAYYTNADGSVVDLTTITTGANGRNVAQERQNFANWYSYYRTRNLMTKTAISQAFSKFDKNVRVVWQTIWPFAVNNGSSGGNNCNTVTGANCTTVCNITTGVGCTNQGRPWSIEINAGTTIGDFTGTRKADFFDWLFKLESSNGTPDRAATVRAGEFFKRSLTKDLKDPYWNGLSGVADSSDLSCRQNFHMLVTDGYWNEGDGQVAAATKTSGADTTLPIAPNFVASGTDSSIYWNVDQNATWNKSLANIAFNYWATDLQPSLPNKVPPYFSDKSTGVTGSTIYDPLTDPRLNAEIFYNPANDPATWQHLVQFMVTLGVDGTLAYPGDLVALRKGTKRWPQTIGNGQAAIDDTWHAAINSRGSYFSAKNPQELVDQLGNLVQSILIRRGSSTALSATMSILTQGTQGFSAGYDTSDWSGFLVKRALNPVTGEPGNAYWDAGCLLTGNGCQSGTTTVATARAPSDRKILTWGNTDKKFEWSSLSTAQQNALKAAGEPTTTNAQLRLEYLRGDRTSETAAPLMRRRGSVLGAIINSQPVFISGPTGGFSDSFPTGSDEANAVATESYSKFLYDNRSRAPTVYAGANDGMMHAFNAVDGTERWAYVPNMLFDNGKLLQMTDKSNTKIVPGVDDMPVIQDAFFDGKWHTVLIGSMRLGGRGIFALDVTDPDSPVVLWEFTNNSVDGDGNGLGYTYSSANVARLSTGKWVVLASTGYYAKDSGDPTSTDAHRDETSLLVIDLKTGVLTKAIPTSTVIGITTFGLSAPAVFDENSDQVDDYAVAGDLAGNLWRFDLRNAMSSSWTADLMFQNYTTAPTAAAPPKQPITVMPVALRDPKSVTPIWVFGTGKYLGAEDRTATGFPSNIGPQAFYGIRDYGPGSAKIVVADLFTQTLTQDATGVRSLTKADVPVAKKGWTFTLSPSSMEPGERNVVTALPLYASNRVILTTLIPKGNDPCDPGRRGAIMVVDAATGGVPVGGAPVAGGTPPGGSGVVGIAVDSDAISSISPPSVIGQHGGGGILLPGIPQFKIPDPPYHRGAWRELLDR